MILIVALKKLKPITLKPFKMKKTLFIITLLLNFTGAFSQTKEETQNWILDKLKKHFNYDIDHSDYDYPSTLSNEDINSFIVDFKDGFLYLSYKFNYSLVFPARSEKGEERIEYKIPIYSLREASCLQSTASDNILKNRFSILLSEYYCDNCGGKFKLSRHSSIVNQGKDIIDGWKKPTVITIPIKSCQPEEDFINRFNKAIQHLKTFYPKPVKKETF